MPPAAAPNPSRGALDPPLRSERGSLGPRWLRAAWQGGLDLLSPPRCSGCDERLARSQVFCAPCAATLVRADPLCVRAGGPALAIVAFGLYGGALADAVRRFKYGDRPDLAQPLGSLARRAAAGADLHAELLVPVPLHPRRLARRGYNQSALLARELVATTGGTLGARTLERAVGTVPQAALDGAARWANVQGVFAVRRPDRVASRTVLLVDDVATTGATLLACSKALREAGARSVRALVLARTERIGSARP